MSDQAARDRIRGSLDESLIVEAAAGTGKTTELVTRLVEVLATGRATVDQIVAVTFTRKAAGELKLRLRQDLDRARDGAEGDRRMALEDALARLETAQIGTIHGFCAALLRARPVEAGVDPAFSELADDAAPRLFGRVFGRWFEEQLDDIGPGLSRALARLVAERDAWRSPLERLRDAAWRLAEWRDFPTRWRRSGLDREGRLATLVAQLHGLATDVDRCEDKGDPLFRALRPVREVSAWIRRAESEAPRDVDALEGMLIAMRRELNRPWHTRVGRGEPYAPGVKRADVRRARDGLIAALDDFGAAADADLAPLLQAELSEVLARYDARKQRTGGLDFVDLLIRTRDLLRDDEAARRAFQSQYTHLFVDEFQDTDPLQVEILLLLAADDPGQTDWRGVRPQPGKLFCVGDPKQSIYRFRRADVAMYHGVCDQLASVGVGRVHLSRSFRAVAPLQAAVNAAFAPEMDGDRAVGQAEYVALEPVRQAPEDRPSLIAWLVDESGWTIEDPDAPGAQIPIEPRHICLLFRRFVSWQTDVTQPYLRALERRGIGHVLVGARSFHQREEIECLRMALQAIEWPDDRLSVYATLRGPLFAIEDRVLMGHLAHGSLHPFAPRDARPEGPLAAVHAALELLGALHRTRNDRPLADTLAELLERTRAHAGFALWPAGNQALANIQRLHDLARQHELSGGLSFRGFVERLIESAERPGAAEPSVLEEALDGVRLMTVHAAKGLEFPVVGLADPTARLATSRPDKHVDPEAGLAAVRLLGCAPAELLEQHDLELARDAAEGQRIAYVAATRTRDVLLVPVVGDEERPDGWLTPLNKAVYPALEQYPSGQPAPGCPAPGSDSVLVRPAGLRHWDGHSVHPGLHAARAGGHAVVWWDPGQLRLDVPRPGGLRSEHVLTQDAAGAAADGMARNQAWATARARALEDGARTAREVVAIAALAADQTPPASAPRVREARVAGEGAVRVHGRRYGTLVHQILRDVALDGDGPGRVELARFHGRVLSATPAEVEAATALVERILAHELMAGVATGDPVLREHPVTLALGEHRLAEGAFDLAWRTPEATWVVVDFKTDPELDAELLGLYRSQVGWYAHALATLTAEPVEAWLLLAG